MDHVGELSFQKVPTITQNIYTSQNIEIKTLCAHGSILPLEMTEMLKIRSYGS